MSIAIYSTIASFSYLLIAWYLRVPAVVGNVAVGAVPPVIRVNTAEGASDFSYFLVTYGPMLPLLLIGLKDLMRKSPNSFWILVILIALSLTPWLTPYTSATLSQWDRVLMTASAIAIPVAISKVGLIRSRIFIASYLLLLILPGLYAVGGPQPSSYNSVLVKSLKRMPPGLSPMPPDRFEFSSLMLASKEVSNLNLSHEPLISGYFDQRFIHLYLRNPTTKELISVGWHDPTAADICRITHSMNLSKVYIFTRRANLTLLSKSFYEELKSYTRLVNKCEKISGVPKYCGSFTINNASLHLRAVYTNELYGIYEVFVTKK